MAYSSGWDPPGGPPPDNEDGRPTLPDWMKGNGLGQLQVLSLQAADGDRKLSTFIVGRTLKELVGDGWIAKTELNGTKYVLRVRDQAKAKKLLSMTQLFDGTEVKVIMHPVLNTRKGVIVCPEIINETEDDLVKWLSEEGVIAVRRMTKVINGVRVNSPTLILTFNSTSTPEYIKVGALRERVRPYIPDPLLCFQCYKYGHSRKHCKGIPTCRNCSGVHSLEGECKADPYCHHCKEAHSPSSRSCSAYIFEKELVRLRYTKNISQKEAIKLAKEGGNVTYSNKLQQRLVMAQEDNDIAKKLEEQIQLNKKLMDTIAILMKRIEDQDRKDREKKKSKKEKKRAAKEARAAEQNGSMENMDYESDSETDQDTAIVEIAKKVAATVAAAKGAATAESTTVATTATAATSNSQVSGAKPKQTVQSFKRQLTSSEISLPSKKTLENPNIPHPIPIKPTQNRTLPQNKTGQQQQQQNKR